MGAWSETIMGNDSILDAEAGLQAVINGEYDCEYVYNRKDIEQNIDLIVKDIDDDRYYQRYAYQCLGVKILETGADVDKRIIDKCIEFCYDDYDNWSNPNKRKFFMEDLKEKLENHEPGKIQKVASEGLFEKIYKGLTGE